MRERTGTHRDEGSAFVAPRVDAAEKWRAWRDSNPRPMASEATTLSG